MTSINTKTGEATTQAVITEDNLYQSDKYKVMVGQGKVGFCTVWNEAKTAVAIAPELSQKAALIGTLYSSQGVNIILRNLALNPHIRELYVWGHGTLSNTKFGIVGSGVLKKLWEQGTTSEGKVDGTTFTLEKEIDRAVVDFIRTNVALIDVSQLDLQGAVGQIKAIENEPYMKPVRFPDAVLEEPDTFPSEQLGFAIHGRGVIDTWVRVVERIMRYGAVKGTQYGSQQKELIGVTWVIQEEDPFNPKLPTDWPKELEEVTGATIDALNEYHQVFLSPDMPPGVKYTYGNRLMRYPTSEGYIDQVKESLIRNLKASPDSRRAVATTLVPPVDAMSDEPPCITQLQVLQREGKMHLLVTVRSHDILKRLYQMRLDYAVYSLQLPKKLVWKWALYKLLHNPLIFMKQTGIMLKKLAMCAFWNRPIQKMYDAAQADPRGVFLIRVSGDKICVDFNSINGQPLLQFEGKSADALALQIAQNELISQSGHAMDIGIQLARAEIAMKKNIPFIQDRPLSL